MNSIERAVIYLLLIALFPRLAIFGQPSNDRFANRAPISGERPVILGDLTGATVELGDPTLFRFTPPWAGTRQSIWWTWTSPGRGTLEVHSSASVVADKAVAVFQGTALDGLASLGSAYDDTPLVVNVERGVAYELAVLTDREQTGGILLFGDFTPSPANDDFVGRAVIAGKAFVLDGTLKGSTDERGDPRKHDVWYEWVAPAAGKLRFRHTAESSVQVSVFTGRDISSLEHFNGSHVQPGTKLIFNVWALDAVPDFRIVGECDRSQMIVNRSHVTYPENVTLRFDADPDYETPQLTFSPASIPTGALTNLFDLPLARTYVAPPPGDYRVNITAQYSDRRDESDAFFTVSPPNDRFDDALQIPGDGGEISVVGLSPSGFEPGEPLQRPSVWWKWQPAQSGYAQITIPWESALYEGDTLASLRRIAPFSRGLFPVTAGTAYRIAVTPGTGRETGSFSVSVFPPPSNDLLSNARLLPLNGGVQGDLSYATAEPGETGVATLWYRWLSPAKGNLALKLVNVSDLLEFVQSSSLRIACFRRDSRQTLVAIPLTGSEFGVRTFNIPVQSGEEILIQISESSSPIGGWSRFALNADFREFPTNDTFAKSALISEIPFLYSYRTTATPFEQGAPPGEGLSSMAWWRWTASRSEQVSISALTDRSRIPGPRPDSLVRVYQGETLGSLIPVHGTTNSFGEFVLDATQGESYYIRVASTTTPRDVVFYLSPRAINDNLSDATPLILPSGKVTTTLLGATLEPGEPLEFGDYPIKGSLWWRFTAPANGFLRHPVYEWFSLLEQPDSTSDLRDVPGSSSRGPWDDTVFVYYPVVARRVYYLKVYEIAFPGSLLLGHTFSYSFSTFRPEASTAGVIEQGSDFVVSIPAIDPAIEGELPFEASVLLAGSPLREITNTPANIRFPRLSPGGYRVTATSVNDRGDIMQPLNRTFEVRATNDYFTLRQRVDSYAFGSLHGTSLETGEALILPPNTIGSLWFEWQAPESETVLFRSSDALLAVFTGTALSNLQSVHPPSKTPQFTAEAGKIYYVASLRTSTNTNVRADFNITRPSPNDRFNQRVVLPPFSSLRLTGSVWLGGLEPGEPSNPNDLASSWWEVRPTNHARIRFEGDLRGWSVLSGSLLTNLQPLPFSLVNPTTAQLDLIAGQNYFLRFASTNASRTTASIDLSVVPTNDDFANAELIPDHQRLSRPILGSRLEPGELPPVATHKEGSVWFRWIASRPAPLEITVFYDRGAFRPVHAELFAGDTLRTLQPISSFLRHAPGEREATVFSFNENIVANTPYFVRFTHNAGGPFSFELRQPPLWPVPNDRFASRILLHTSWTNIVGEITGASPEQGVSPNNGSLWWSWRAPADGTLRVVTPPHVALGLFQGDTLKSLVSLGAGPFAVQVKSGEDIQIQLSRTSEAIFEFHLEFITPAPGNFLREAPRLIPFTEKAFLADWRAVPGRLAITGELAEFKPLYWRWIAPVAGTLSVRADDPQNSVWPPSSQITHVVAGRPYDIITWGKRTGWFHLDFVPFPWRTTLNVPAGGAALSFRLTGPLDGVVKVESSSDLRTWSPFDLLWKRTVGDSFFETAISDDPEMRFFRFTPVR